jgi:translation initiation factor IF-3
MKTRSSLLQAATASAAELGAHVMMRARVNGRITAREVRVIDEIGEELGVLALSRALDLARGRGEDLIEVGPDDVPPLCQIMDYGKYRWQLQQSRKDREHD